MRRPNQDFLDWAKEYEPLIASAARQYSKAAEYDDLYQEGMIALWNVYPEPNSKIVSKAVYNRMKNWIDRKSTRLNSSHVSESRMPSSA